MTAIDLHSEFFSNDDDRLLMTFNCHALMEVLNLTRIESETMRAINIRKVARRKQKNFLEKRKNENCDVFYF